jgi:DNA mismatch repair ATPase MutS
MATEMIRVDAEVLQRALAKKPKYLNKTGYLSQLIEEALDNCDKIMDSERERAFYIHRDRDSLKGEGISTDLEKKVDDFIKEGKAKKAESLFTPAFEKFWSIHYNAPKNSVGSKKEAFEEWKKALKKETPERLIEALMAAVDDQRVKLATDEFAPALKQAQSWLKKEMYSSWLDLVVLKQEQYHPDKPLIL